MSAKHQTPIQHGHMTTRAYSASLQQAAAAVFGMASVEDLSRLHTHKNFREKK